ncbi:MAG: NAD(P)-dependent oxidoreductase [Chitinophagales bacterium]|nr:MAG: NAD(P)-dependent oxidoreductase [Chitinophagales bacterium]
MELKILVTGANGQLGTELRTLAVQYPRYSFIFTDLDQLDITRAAATEDFIRNCRPHFLINCAAYTAVDLAESNMEAAFSLNTEAVRTLAHITAALDIKLIHISTDFVFDGRKNRPYVEDDLPAPLNIYGKSKWRGEEACLQENPHSIIVRTSWLYSPFGNNFVKTVQRLCREKKDIGIIYDQIGTPTYAHDLAAALMVVVSKASRDTWGIFHYSNEGVCSWYDFAEAIKNLSRLSCRILPLETSEYPTPAKRPAYAVLNKKKIKQTFGIDIPHWQQSLAACIERMHNV